LSRAKRKNHDFAIMFIDLDGFKNVNDTLGHDVGDALLKDVAIRLTSTVREEDLVSRIGGDEFIIVFEETCREELETISSRIIGSIGNPYFLADKEAHVTPSIGIALFPEHGVEIDSLVDHADKAMYAAKNSGKSTYHFYSHDLKYEEESHRESLIAKFKKIFQK
jgi:diguanylate cyclase